MNPNSLLTRNLRLVPRTIEELRSQIEGLAPEHRAQVSREWLARLEAARGEDAVWMLGFTLVHRLTETVVGQSGFKGPPSAEGVVEIAYMVEPEHQGKGYATEAANALADFAFSSGQVRLVRAHTLREQNASTRVLAKCGFRQVGDVIDSEDGLVWRWEKENR